MNRYTRISMLLCMLMASVSMKAQFRAQVIDAQTGEPISYAVARYEGTGIGATCDSLGYFSVPMEPGRSKLLVTCVGYSPQTVTVNYGVSTQNAVVKMFQQDLMIGEVIVRPRKERYRRKDNPAVELMRRVIKEKERNSLRNADSYHIEKYTKHTVAVNEVSPKTFTTGFLKQFSFLKDHAESSPETGKLIVPLMVSEQLSEDVCHGRGSSVQHRVTAEQSDGFNTIFNISEFFTTYVKDIFTDIDIYQNDCRVLQHPFISPISSMEAISFYHYYIADTLMVDGKRCIDIAFLPSNVQDFGFSGNLYVTDEACPVLRRCVLNIPHHSGVNFVENLIVTQDFELHPSGVNVLKRDNMVVELRYTDKLIKFHAQRLTVNKMVELPSEYEFPKLQKYASVENSDSLFWQQQRPVNLSEAEASIHHLVHSTSDLGGYGFVMVLVKALVENAVELTKAPNKFDLMPVNTLISSNYVDGMRFRLGGQTTANLHPQLFWRGYGAYGTKDKRLKYKSEVEYSFNKKKYMAHEFPRRSVIATYLYDDMSPVDQFAGTDKDNLYTSVRTAKVEHMMYVRSGTVKLNYETDSHLLASLSYTRSRNTPAGRMVYAHNHDGSTLSHIDNSSLTLGLRYAPHENFANSKQQRLLVNSDAPVFTLEHTIADKNLGSDYAYNVTEASVYKRFWLPLALGNFDVMVKGGMQWNKVPFTYLFIPQSNMSYFIQFDNWSFCMLDNIEFLNDRYVSAFAHWNLNGKLLNRVPLLRKLKLREYVGFKILYGKLSDRNNPFVSEDNFLLRFPETDGRQTTFAMDSKPYMEFSAGIANIFKVLTVQYVRRLSYTDMPGMNTKKNGVRFAIDITF